MTPSGSLDPAAPPRRKTEVNHEKTFPDLSIRSDFSIHQSLTVQQPAHNMTQEQIDAQFGPILDGLFTGKTTQTIINENI